MKTNGATGEDLTSASPTLGRLIGRVRALVDCGHERDVRFVTLRKMYFQHLLSAAFSECVFLAIDSSLTAPRAVHDPSRDVSSTFLRSAQRMQIGRDNPKNKNKISQHLQRDLFLASPLSLSLSLYGDNKRTALPNGFSRYWPAIK